MCGLLWFTPRLYTITTRARMPIRICIRTCSLSIWLIHKYATATPSMIMVIAHMAQW